MEFSGKKRKGLCVLAVNKKKLTSVELAQSHLSLKEYSRRKKKSKETVETDYVGFRRNAVPGVVTAPLCCSSCFDSPSRGLKRKIGCIDSATRLGRKKKVDQEYELGDILGQGKFASVMLCWCKESGEQFACKTLRKGEDTVHREVEIMQHLSGHPGVVTLKAVYEDPDYFHLVMELCSGGRLLDQMAKQGQYSEQQAANLIKELMVVIKYCHEMGVVHRDIKPENILLTTSGQIKLADFGLAVRIIDGQNLIGVVGSPAYVAPEVLVGDYSEKVDVWSAGILLYALLFGVLPFQGDSLETMFEAIKKDNLELGSGVWESVSQPACDLIYRMLTRDVSARFAADDVLRHPWILFYTGHRMKKLTQIPHTKFHVKLPSSRHQTNFAGVESKGNMSGSASHLRNNFGHCEPPENSSAKMLEAGDCDLVEILAVAISNIRISEPKRSRLWNPVRPVQQECPSEMKPSSLCTAF